MDINGGQDYLRYERRGKATFDGCPLPRLEIDENILLQKPWMRIWTDDRIFTFGSSKYGEANLTRVEDGLREIFGSCHHWWRKLGAMLSPDGQLKNFFNAALVANQIPNGGKLAILGSKYSAGSGDWIIQLARWLDYRQRAMTIHCIDPNEDNQSLVVGQIRVHKIQQAVNRDDLSGYDGIVDDIFEVGEGYTYDSQQDVKYLSCKLPHAMEIGGSFYPNFLHEKEARFFSFPMDWIKQKTDCSCQRCKIESYLDIRRFADIVQPSYCHNVIPELQAAHLMWANRATAVPLFEKPVLKRAKKVEQLQLVSKEDRKEVTAIVGYSPAEVPFFTSQSGGRWWALNPIVVKRPGAQCKALNILVTRQPEKGWHPFKMHQQWYYQHRPKARRWLKDGSATIICNGVEIERNVSYQIMNGTVRQIMVGKVNVTKWCFIHGCEDGCALDLSFLPYHLCKKCHHRHGPWDISYLDVDNECGGVKIDNYRDHSKFIQGIMPHNKEWRVHRMTSGTLDVIRKDFSDQQIQQSGGIILDEYFYLLDWPRYYSDTTLIQFQKHLREEGIPWHDGLLTHVRSPVRLLFGNLNWYDAKRNITTYPIVSISPRINCTETELDKVLSAYGGNDIVFIDSGVLVKFYDFESALECITRLNFSELYGQKIAVDWYSH